MDPQGLFLDRPHPGQAWMRLPRSYKPVGHLSTDITRLMLGLDGKYSFHFKPVCCHEHESRSDMARIGSEWLLLDVQA